MEQLLVLKWVLMVRLRDESTQTVTNVTYMSHQVMRVWILSTANSTIHLNGKYTFTGCTLNSRVGYSSLNAVYILFSKTYCI
jgi:hypothetical protein